MFHVSLFYIYVLFTFLLLKTFINALILISFYCFISCILHIVLVSLFILLSSLLVSLFQFFAYIFLRDISHLTI